MTFAEQKAEEVLKDWPMSTQAVLRQAVKELVVIAVHKALKEAAKKCDEQSQKAMRPMTTCCDCAAQCAADVLALQESQI